MKKLDIDSQVPELRIRHCNQRPVLPEGRWVVYWMTAFRRTRSNYALQVACDLAKRTQRPLIILEGLRVRYRWASDRFHRFVIEGMHDNEAACADSHVLYYPYVEPQAGAGSGLIEALADRATAVVTDDFPCFFHPRMLRAISGKLPCALLAVDANGLMPLQAAERTFTVAHSYRRWMQKQLPEHLQHPPDPNPLDGRSLRTLPKLAELPESIQGKWPRAELAELLAAGGLSQLPIDHSVGPGAIRGGAASASQLLKRFVEQRLGSYDSDRNEPDQEGSSELSPHLHFGHISAHEVFFEVMHAADWHPYKLQTANGKVNGFWGVDENAEAFLDQLCTWREIGFNMCWREPNYDALESLPEWALRTIEEHASDERPIVYSLAEFEEARTHDPIWNAAQRQLVREGQMHNYLRMLWGKKILQWSRSAQESLDVMIELNNKYALDGRDPNSYSGIFWVLGRYDRAWGPQRQIFGKLRYMTSENTARKHALKKYLQRYASEN